MFRKLIKDLSDGTFDAKMGEIARQTIDEKYAFVEDNNRPYTVTVKRNKKSVTVIAQGEDVVFKEFGAGVGTKNPRNIVGISDGGFSRSEKGTGEYAKYGSWHHKKKPKMSGLPSTNAFEKAIQVCKNQFESEFYKLLMESKND